MKAIFSILFVLVCMFCNAQVGGSAVDYSQLSAADKQQRTVDSLAYVAQKRVDSISLTQKAQQIAALKSFAYKGLNGFTAGSTLTSAQIQEALQLYLYNQGAFNPATNKIDSTLNYIK